MAVLGVTTVFSSGTAIVASQMNTNFDDIEAFVNTTPGLLQLTGGTITGAVQLNNTLTLGSSGAGHDVVLWGDTTGDYFWYDADTNKLVLEGTNGATVLDVTDGNVVIGDGTLTVGSDGAGEDVTFYSDTAGDHFVWDSSAEKLTITGTAAATALDIADGNVTIADDLDVDGTTNLDAVCIDGSVDLDGEMVVGANTDGYDVQFFGNADGSYLLWDESADQLHAYGSLIVAGNTTDAVDMGLVGGVATIRGINVGANAYNDLDIRCGSTTQLYLDTAGTVGVGIATPDNLLHVWEASAGSVAAHADAQVTIENSGTAGLQFLSNSAEENRIIFGDAADNDIGGITYDHNDNTMNFYASAGKAARFLHNSGGGRLVVYGGASSAAEGGEIELDGGTSYSADFFFDRYGDDIRWLWGGVTKFQIASDGDLTNTNNSYGAISDERVKTDIEPARDYLADLLNLEVVNFVIDKQFVATSDTEGTFEALDEPSIKQLGMVAQQVEQHIAGLVKEDRFGVKSMKSSVLVPMLLQAVQTLTARIVALEAA